MVLCKSCKKKDKREYADDCFACDNGDQWEAKRHRSQNKQKTNADRIRSMKDEKLAELLRDYQCNTCDFSGFCEETDKCEEEIFKWLKQEYTP